MESNEELKQKVEHMKLPKISSGQASNKAKGKKRAPKGRPRMEDGTVNRADSQETDESYREEVRAHFGLF